MRALIRAEELPLPVPGERSSAAMQNEASTVMETRPRQHEPREPVEHGGEEDEATLFPHGHRLAAKDLLAESLWPYASLNFRSGFHGSH